MPCRFTPMSPALASSQRKRLATARMTFKGSEGFLRAVKGCESWELEIDSCSEILCFDDTNKKTHETLHGTTF